MSEETFGTRLAKSAATMKAVGESLTQAATPQRYSHRNGETLPPTVMGDYWIDDWCGSDKYFGDPDIYRVHTTMDGILEVEFYDSREPGTPVLEINARWWGPIPKPPLGN